jgi:hypothetical protein
LVYLAEKDGYAMPVKVYCAWRLYLCGGFSGSSTAEGVLCAGLVAGVCAEGSSDITPDAAVGVADWPGPCAKAPENANARQRSGAAIVDVWRESMKAFSFFMY